VKKVKEKKICHTDQAVTGSLFPERTCKTKAEWDAEAAAVQGKGRSRQSSSAAAGEGD
jgi:hypothetical protein